MYFLQVFPLGLALGSVRASDAAEQQLHDALRVCY